MKKLMIAAAIVCAAALSQAAQFSWTMSGVTDSPDATKAAGWAVYFLDASKAEGLAAAEDLVSYVTDSKNYLYKDVTSAGRNNAISADSTQLWGSYGKGQNQSGFIVIFDNEVAADAGYYAMTGIKTSDTVGDLDNNISIAFGDFTSATAATGGWQSVPEPTSGLLLLIGVAGLALRRRRA